MRKKLVLVEYMGQCSKDGQLLGHSYKVQQEYYDMLRGAFDVSIVTPENTKNSVFDLSKVVFFPKYHSTVAETMTLSEKIRDFKNKLKNLHSTVKNTKTDYYWFYNIDFSLITYLFFHRKTLKKSILTVYRNTYGGFKLTRFIKGKMFEHVIKNSLLNIYTGKSFVMPEKNSYFMPDYYYIPEKYDKYQQVEQENLVVCLGTMNRFKLLDPTIDAFRKMKYPLYIAGKFYDEEWKKSLESKLTDNIKLEDKYLDSEEYLDIFAKAKYCIIPYDKGMYNMRTSGVLQECIFTKTIPLTFDWFLEQNESLGLAVKDLSDVNDELLHNYDAEAYKAWCDEQIHTRYNRENICKELIEAINRRGV